jgi:hypothetical protein
MRLLSGKRVYQELGTRTPTEALTPSWIPCMQPGYNRSKRFLYAHDTYALGESRTLPSEPSPPSLQAGRDSHYLCHPALARSAVRNWRDGFVALLSQPVAYMARDTEGSNCSWRVDTSHLADAHGVVSG